MSRELYPNLNRSNLVGGIWNFGSTVVRAINRAALSIYPGTLQPEKTLPNSILQEPQIPRNGAIGIRMPSLKMQPLPSPWAEN